MNIFVLHQDPIEAAWQVCDKHAVKMPTETAQMLCAVAHQQNLPTPYKPTHVSHPCTVWTGSSKESFNWTLLHGLALCETYTARYKRRHASQDVIEYISTLSLKFKKFSAPPFALAMPEKYRVHDAVQSYRNFYIGDKAYFAKWKSPAVIPDWFVPAKTY